MAQCYRIKPGTTNEIEHKTSKTSLSNHSHNYDVMEKESGCINPFIIVPPSPILGPSHTRTITVVIDIEQGNGKESKPGMNAA